MSLNDLRFEFDSEVIYTPFKLEGVAKAVTITNYGDTTLTNLGIYIVPATSSGDVDYPANFPPETDYMDIIEYGTATDSGAALVGGLIISCTQNGPVAFEDYVTRTRGASYATKIALEDLAPNASTVVTLEMEPPAALTRRFFVNIVVE